MWLLYALDSVYVSVSFRTPITTFSCYRGCCWHGHTAKPRRSRLGTPCNFTVLPVWNPGGVFRLQGAGFLGSLATARAESLQLGCRDNAVTPLPKSRPLEPRFQGLTTAAGFFFIYCVFVYRMQAWCACFCLLFGVEFCSRNIRATYRPGICTTVFYYEFSQLDVGGGGDVFCRCGHGLRQLSLCSQSHQSISQFTYTYIHYLYVYKYIK